MVITLTTYSPGRLLRDCSFPRRSRMGLDQAGCRLEQAELAGSGDRGGAVLDDEFAVQGALVGFHGVQ